MFLLLLFALSAVDAVVARLEQHYNRLETLQALFTQIYRADEGSAPREESGTVYLKKPGRMRWEYKRPENKLFISDGKMVYFYAPADKQVTRMPVKESSDLRTPLRFLLGKMNLKRIFERIEIATDMAPLDPGNDVLRALPKPQGENFRQMYLEVDRQDRLRRLVIFESDGARSEFRLAGELGNPPLDGGLFKFVIPPGVEVVDERPER